MSRMFGRKTISHLLKAMQLALLAGILFSCNNLAETQGTGTGSGSSQKMCIISGSVSPDGAYPSSMSPSTLDAEHPVSGNSSSAKNATTNFPSTGLTYEVYAKNFYSGERVDGTVTSSTYTLSLPYGTWLLYANAYYSGKVIYQVDGAYAFTLSDANPVNYQEHLYVSPIISSTSEYKGTVNLNLSVESDSGITKGKATWTGGSENFTFNAAGSYAATFTLGGGEVAPGNYKVHFEFYNDKNIVLYACNEYVNVYGNLTTDLWYNDNSVHLTGSGSYVTFNISKSTVSALNQISEVYVKGSGGSLTGTASDEGNGTKQKPYASMQTAMDRILACNDGTSTYTLYIDGNVSGTNALSDITPDTNLNLKICGLNGDADKDCITGISSGTITNLMKINGSTSGVTVNLELKDFTAKNNYNNNGGYGGLYLNSCATTVTGTVKVTGNKSTTLGGGIGVLSGSFDTSGCDSFVVSGNSSALNGGGIYSNGTLTLKNAEISGNTAGSSTVDVGEDVYGGGIYSLGPVSISDSTIKNNKALFPAAGSYGAYGGGLCGYSSTLVNLSGSVYVSGNTATTSGNGAYIVSTAPIKFEGNINFDEADDIYLTNIEVIKVSGNLTPSFVGTISDSSYSSTIQVLSAGDGVTLSDQVGKFKVKESGWTIDNNGYLSVSADGSGGVNQNVTDNISYAFDKTSIYEGTKDTFTLTITKDAGLATETDVTDDVTGLSIVLSAGGASLPSTYGSVSTKVVTLNPGIPAGTVVQAAVSFQYNGKSYGGTISIPVNAITMSSADVNTVTIAIAATTAVSGTVLNVTITDPVESGLSSINTILTRNLKMYDFLYTLDLSSGTFTSVPDSAFCEPSGGMYSASDGGLEEIILPSTVTSIDKEAFFLARKLKKIVLPDAVTTLSTYAFASCELLSDVTLSSSLEKIGIYAFNGDSALTTITIPAAVKFIGNSAFASSGLTSATFEKTTGWYVSDSADVPTDWTDTTVVTEVPSTVFASTSAAATALTTTYSGKYWHRKTE